MGSVTILLADVLIEYKFQIYLILINLKSRAINQIDSTLNTELSR